MWQSCSVLRLLPKGSQRLPALNYEGIVTVVSNLPKLIPGEYLSLRRDNYPQSGEPNPVGATCTPKIVTKIGVPRAAKGKPHDSQ